jgi:murein DD-endopeptidase MepM/ murein hydrolase activator NlpD
MPRTLPVRKSVLGEEASALGVPWYWVPGKERFTLAALPDRPPGSASVFPVRFKTVVSGPDKGARSFGYKRPGGRAHGAVDLYGRHMDPVFAMADGRIVSFYYFYEGTYALFVDHGDYVVNYGEVDPSSLSRLKLDAELTNTYERRKIIPTDKIGSTVKAGDQIAFVGKLNSGSSMLHLEMYRPGTKFNLPWRGFPNSPAPDAMYNPTDFLLDLVGEIKPKAEVLLPAVCS